MELVVPLPAVADSTVLRSLGLSEKLLAREVQTGRLVRVRHGVYATPDAPREQVRAARIGGRLTSYSALRARDLWCPPGDDRLHVAVGAHARALRDPDSGAPFAPRADVVVHWRAQPARLSRLHEQLPLPAVMRHLPSALDSAFVVAVLDSALRRGAVTTWELSRSFAGVPRLLRALARADPRAESGIESVARCRLREARLDVRPQVRIGRYRVDFLVGERVVVEIDGREHHDDPVAFERDRRRAAELTRLGYRVLHFSYSQVLFDWPSCLAAVRAALVL
jgi:very-short-patch-repair endonuclease